MLTQRETSLISVGIVLVKDNCSVIAASCCAKNTLSSFFHSARERDKSRLSSSGRHTRLKENDNGAELGDPVRSLCKASDVASLRFGSGGGMAGEQSAEVLPQVAEATAAGPASSNSE